MLNRKICRRRQHWTLVNQCLTPTDLVRANEANENTSTAHQVPGIDAIQSVSGSWHMRRRTQTHATVMIMQMAKPRLTVMYLGARLAMSLPAG